MSGNILICGLNWLGDGIMSMPAIQLFRQKHPEAKITVLIKRSMVPLWKMQGAVDSIIELDKGLVGALAAASKVREKRFDHAYIFPNSFRSALIPFLAGVPRRRGVRGHHRSFMLNDVAEISAAALKGHQSMEYMDILGLDASGVQGVPVDLTVHADVMAKTMSHLGDIKLEKTYIGMIPGAAYGPSKRWPSEYYSDVGRQLGDSDKHHLILIGSNKEAEVCRQIAEGAGEKALSLSGVTSLEESIALLSKCSVVICNDSGGMHLAAAAGARTVAIFGITDPSKTGPLGEGHEIISAEGVEQNRDLDRDSNVAANALRSIKPDRVYAAVMDVLR